MTLGEKLRQAREERGISINEVAEQTRIAPLYIESIENDDYSPLPGGIFNKGFIKSFAKFVGVDEQEAMQDYARLMSEQNAGKVEEETKTYRPEVLTDDRSTSSLVPTIIFAVIILGLMTLGILALVNYIQSQPSEPAANANTANIAVNTNANTTNANVAEPLPATDEINVELKTASDPVSISYTVDKKPGTKLVTPDSPLSLEAQESVKFSFAKSLAQSLQMSLNGKQIGLPSAPANPRRIAIEIEINKENIKQILQSGSITFDNPAVPTASPR